ncbi:MAG: hypothetical protein IKP00_08165 [Victivallales bacterium]|nr:hypothetical protein [Victivallales bacterium]
MNEEYLAKARQKVSDVRMFIVGVSRRASELAKGARPLIRLIPGEENDWLDIALQEVAEGKVVITPGTSKK